MSPELRTILSILSVIFIIAFVLSLMITKPDPFEDIKKYKDGKD